MKRFAFILLVSLWGISAGALTNTNVVAFAQINVAPEKFKNKKVVYTEEYRTFLTAFPNYMENSGYKPDKWFLLEIGDTRLPVMLHKKTDTAAMIAELKPGSKVRVEGRVKEFKVEARNGLMPNYFVEADEVVFVSAPVPGANMGPRDNEMRRGGRRMRPNFPPQR